MLADPKEETAQTQPIEILFQCEDLRLEFDTSTTVLASILLPLHESFTPFTRCCIVRPLLKSVSNTTNKIHLADLASSTSLN